MERIKWLLSILWACISVFLKQYALIIIFVAVAVIFDWITGMIKAEATGEGLNSKKATKGFWKKVALFAALFFGFFLDYFIPYCIKYIGIHIPINALFGMIFGCYIVINECISVAENLFIINPSILPSWVVKLLTTAKEQVDVKGDIDEKEGN